MDRRLFDRLTTRPAPRVDAAIYPLSQAADQAKLWIGCAALLAAWPHRRGRRAAGRGLLAVALTSAVCNAVLKPAFRRARPTSIRSAGLERVATVAGSTSFPSGHAASAFAFAVGAGMEAPAVAVPIGTLAAAVAYSRIRTRVHYPGDVVAGATLGTVIAAATRKLWPSPRTEAAVVRRVAENVAGVSISNGGELAIVVNPSAGSTDTDAITEALRSQLPGAALISVGDELPLDRALHETEASAVLAIVGGDGSINAAAEHALATGRPLAVLPGGTLNHFARDLGIAEASHTISALQHGHVFAVDVGLIDGKPFLNTASFGTYAEFVDAREKLENRLGKWAAAFIAAARVLRHAEPIRVDLDGQRRQIWMIFIGNCEYQPPGVAPSRRERLDDGLLDVRYLDGTSRGSRIRFVIALMSGRLSRSNVYHHALVRSMHIHSLDGPLRLARDGETFDGGIDVHITKHADRLAIYAPRPTSSDLHAIADGRPETHGRRSHWP